MLGDMHPTTLGSPDDLAKRLGETGYLCDDSLATIGYLALAMHRPLLLEGAPGTGKTALPEAFAEALDLLLARPVLRALREAPAVLLVDEIDRADDEFEAFLLEVLSTYQVTIPELGTIRAVTPPIVVLTSNRTREVHDALKRRCLYNWIDHPGLEREVAIVRHRAPEVSQQLAEQVVTLVQQLGGRADLQKPPGVAE